MDSDLSVIDQKDSASVREILSGSGYSEKAIDYFLNRPHWGSMPDADHKSELTGQCGDTMKVYLKLDNGRIKDAKYQVLGCPAAVASAMALADLIKDRTIEEAQNIMDRDVFRNLEEIPDQKQHCIRLAVKTLQKAIDEYIHRNDSK